MVCCDRVGNILQKHGFTGARRCHDQPALTFPDPSGLTNGAVWTIALTMAIVASIETLLCVEATDKLDTEKRVTPTNLELKAQGLGIFLIEHDIHNVMKLCDRASVMKNGQLVGTVNVNEVTDDDILGMIILGKQPAKAA